MIDHKNHHKKNKTCNNCRQKASNLLRLDEYCVLADGYIDSYSVSNDHVISDLQDLNQSEAWYAVF